MKMKQKIKNQVIQDKEIYDFLISKGYQVSYAHPIKRALLNSLEIFWPVKLWRYLFR
jgi:DNA-directed RNA polymerase alpha subunit